MSNKLTPLALHLLGFKQDFPVAITFCTYLEKGIQEIRPDTFDSLTKNKIPLYNVGKVPTSSVGGYRQRKKVRKEH
jgi:hypothetical protein